MSKHHDCDFCGRSRTKIPDNPSGSSPKLTIDDDGLLVCWECGQKLNSSPIGSTAFGELDEKLMPLVGKNAGAICRTLNLPYKPPYQSVIDAASLIGYDQDLYMSTWIFVTQWLDGTTIWRSEDGSAKAIVSRDGSIWIESS
jgi:hypothetical protein